MSIVGNNPDAVIGGVDTHVGGVLGVESFATTRAGYCQLVSWLRSHGELVLVGVEGTGSYGVGLARYLARAGVAVVEVDRPNRQMRHRQGKSDPVDAVAAARAGPGTGHRRRFRAADGRHRSGSADFCSANETVGDLAESALLNFEPDAVAERVPALRAALPGLIDVAPPEVESEVSATVEAQLRFLDPFEAIGYDSSRAADPDLQAAGARLFEAGGPVVDEWVNNNCDTNGYFGGELVSPPQPMSTRPYRHLGVRCRTENDCRIEGARWRSISLAVVIGLRGSWLLA